ncbi:GntR family transcriptional regulator [Ruegeria pomeroyi]|uniref:GntR family transcriptional regulator n=1 Tax=Ruegeria pomeroyi TaxID=89184 RepID=UPI001F3FA7FD|nr:GntR family transcriptional regulator [Ruegeria pomeroyi]MCE8509782.1 GntR family transcriptional regulator [Ruegeria pomeroyi]MCE8524949.1 GntR family transcriptional regulator [Ruegeria pomeroyi]
MAKFQTVDIGRSASAASIIFAALRRAIVEGDLADGEPLRQDEIARSFNTSRIPVREALTMLEQQGLVKTERYKGAVVAGLSMAEATEIFDFRALVEAEVMRRAVPNMTTEVLDTARACLERFAAASDPMHYGDLNREFHETLYRASALPYHLGVIENAMDRIDRYLRAQLVLSDGMERARREHLAILDACAKGEAERAAALTAEHIHGARDSLAEHMEQRNG